MTPVERIRGMGLVIPPVLGSVGEYARTYEDGHSLWVSGHTARTKSEPALAGIVGLDLTVEQGAEQAALAALNLLSAVDSAVGLNQITGVIHLRGFVRSDQDFTEHATVINGASTLFNSIFADAPKHARTSIGLVSLPGGAAVELEAIFALRELNLR